jgi:hypothetical protein
MRKKEKKKKSNLEQHIFCTCSVFLSVVCNFEIFLSTNLISHSPGFPCERRNGLVQYSKHPRFLMVTIPSHFSVVDFSTPSSLLVLAFSSGTCHPRRIRRIYRGASQGRPPQVKQNFNIKKLYSFEMDYKSNGSD